MNVARNLQSPRFNARALTFNGRSGFLLRSGVADDFEEGLRVEAGSSYECAVDVFEAAESSGVVGFDGASVEDADFGGELGCEGLCDLGADDAVCVVGDLGGGGAACADGPDGLVGEDDGGGFGVVDAFEGHGGLKFEHAAGFVGLALFELLADADDGDEGVFECGFELEIDGGVGFVEVLAALGVADNNVGGADGGDHDGRGLAGEGSFVLPAHVLGADEDGFSAGGVDESGQGGHGGAEDDVALIIMFYEWGEVGEECGGFGGGLVHLPVGGDQ